MMQLGVGFLVLLAPLAAAPQSTAASKPVSELAVANAYAAYAHEIYRQASRAAGHLKRETDSFLQQPDAKRLRAARSAWRTAREIYGRSEVLRFYNGPIDNGKDGPETLLNAWPVDEGFIDVVRGRPAGGVLQDQKRYPNLSATVLSLANERGGEANICVGWHAVEFMLWGQDFDKAGPGNRKPTAFVVGKDAHAARRREYLRVVTSLLLRHLQQLQAAWEPKKNNYRSAFVKKPRDAVRRALTGMIVLGGFEMAGERMAVAYETRDQEQEHSCFSDTTLQDLIANQLGIVAVYRGGDSVVKGTVMKGAVMKGYGLRHLALARDKKLAAAIDRQLDLSLSALRQIPGPFDQAILGPDKSRGRKALLAAMTALETQTDLLAALGIAFGFQIPIQPSGR